MANNGVLFAFLNGGTRGRPVTVRQKRREKGRNATVARFGLGICYPFAREKKKRKKKKREIRSRAGRFLPHQIRQSMQGKEKEKGPRIGVTQKKKRGRQWAVLKN